MSGYLEKLSLPLQLQPEAKQQLHVNQRLMMSASMQQAIRLLQLPLVELQSYIEEQIVLNPILEIEEKEEIETETEENSKEEGIEEELSINEKDFSILDRLDEEWKEHFAEGETLSFLRTKEEEKKKSYQEQSIPQQYSLYQKLIQEAKESFTKLDELAIAEILIGYIDSFGFLSTPLQEICILHQLKKDKVDDILKKIQTFEPSGVGAKDIQECLLIQLQSLHKENTLAYLIVKNYYSYLLHNQIPLIQKKTKRSYAEIQKAIIDIAYLDLHPGTKYALYVSQTLIPDLTIREEKEKLIIEVDREYVPALHLNYQYLDLLKNGQTPAETKRFIKHHLFSARWLMRNLQHRYSTIERIAEVLIQKQHIFFTQPLGQLVPLTMKSVAEELNLHESTIARTVADKYLQTPRGIFPLRAFFTTKYISEVGEDLSSSTIKQTMTRFIAEENKQHPLSDEKISRLLKQKGMICARRTIAKYREILKIGNAQQRKKFS